LSGDQYGAGDFEGVLNIFVWRTSGGNAVEDPHDAKRPNQPGDEPPDTSDLAARIARARAAQPARQRPGGVKGGGLIGASRGYRLASEFVAALVVGGGLGYGIDEVAHTRPWAMLVLLILGFAAGVRNVMRAAAEMNAGAADDATTPDDETKH
jgi:ATP synthase protein I